MFMATGDLFFVNGDEIFDLSAIISVISESVFMKNKVNF